MTCETISSEILQRAEKKSKKHLPLHEKIRSEGKYERIINGVMVDIIYHTESFLQNVLLLLSPSQKNSVTNATSFESHTKELLKSGEKLVPPNPLTLKSITFTISRLEPAKTEILPVSKTALIYHYSGLSFEVYNSL